MEKRNLAIDGEPKDAETVIDPEETPMLARVTRVHTGESLTLLGSTIQIGTQHHAEWEAV